MPVNAFKWKHFAGEIILLNVRWYLKYASSYKNLEEIMAERGIKVDHTTIMRWVHEYSPEIEKKVRRYLKPTNDSWRMESLFNFLWFFSNFKKTIEFHPNSLNSRSHFG